MGEFLQQLLVESQKANGMCITLVQIGAFCWEHPQANDFYLHYDRSTCVIRKCNNGH